MKRITICSFLFLFGILSSCDKFLDVKPKGVIVPETLDDYEEMLNSFTMTETFPMNLLDFTDDYYTQVDSVSQSPQANGYLWRPQLTVDEKVSPAVWGYLYRRIYNANVIISGVAQVSDGTPQHRKSVAAEAYVIRANCYLDLLTVFAKAYNTSTAADDPGLPLVTSINVTDKTPARSSVQATLKSIIDDVTVAIDDLPESNLNRFRVTKYVAYGLLSRIYLYMQDYAKAEEFTDNALKQVHTILDYNSYTAKEKMPIYDLNPEILWQRAGGSPTFLLYSKDLKSYFDTTDIRYVFLTVENNDGIGRSPLPGRYSYGIGFPELYLTKAEILARRGLYGEAIDIVNMLRKSRVRKESYVKQTAQSGEDALQKVLAERRRELAFSGLRWFDMKRLDQDNRMPEVRRINAKNGTLQAKLAPHSPNYTFEIPVRVQMFNPSMVLNHR